jgi:ribosomal protein S19
MEENFVAAESRREVMMKKFRAREFRRLPRNVHFPTPDQIFNGEEFFSVEINVPGEEENQQQMRVVVQPRFRKHMLAPEMSGHSTQMRIGKDTASADTTP